MILSHGGGPPCAGLRGSPGATAWTGPARLQLFQHMLAPLADLPVLEIVSAGHILTDLTLNRVEPVHDYLKGVVTS